MKGNYNQNFNTHFLELSKDLMCITDFDGYLKYVNPAWEDLFGYSEKDLRSKPFQPFTHSDDQTKIDEKYHELFNGKTNISIEDKHIGKNGSVKYIRWTATPFAEEKEIYCIGQDITEKKQLEIELNESQKISKTGSWSWDIVNNKISWSQELFTIMKLEPSKNKPSYELALALVHPDDREYYKKSLGESLKKSTANNIEYRLQLNDGTIINVQGRYATINDPYGKPIKMFGTVQDITDRKLVEEALKASEEKFRSLFDNINVGVALHEIVLDEEGKPIDFIFLDVNSTYEKLTTLKKEAIVGKYGRDVIPNIEQMWIAHYGKVAESGKAASKIEYSYFLDKYWDVQAYSPAKNKFAVAISDITNRVKAENRLKKNEHLFRFLAENAKDMIYRMSIPDGIYEYVSPACVELFGYTVKEFYGNPLLIQKLIHPDWKKYFNIEWKNLLNGNIPPFYEYQVIHKSGTVRWMNQRNSLIRDEKGNPIAIEGVVTDVTKRKQTEEVLLNNQKCYKKAQEMGHVGNWEYSPATTKFWGSDEAKRIFGLDLNALDFTLEKIESYVIEKERVHKALIDLIEHEKKYDLIYDIIPHGKKVRKTIHSIAELEKDAEGNVIKITGVISDITESKQIEKELIFAKEKAEEKTTELKQQQVLFETMFNTIKEGVVITNTKREILLANNGMNKTFGFNPKKLIGKQTKILYANSSMFKEIGKKVFSKKSPISDDQYLTYYKRKDGTVFPGETFESKLYDDKKAWIGNISIIRDVSEREKFISELKIAKEKAEESDCLKSAFLANMSHEIRTPMNGILGFTSLLKEPGLSGKEQQQFIDIIRKSGNRMLSTINDIIDISKIESGQVDVIISDINLNKQLDEQLEFFLPEAKNNNLKLSIANRLPAHQANFRSDKEKLNSILTNFIKNAIKYTKVGSVEFGYIIKRRGKKSELEFYVKDTGIGIPEERQKAVFNRFVQADIEDRQVYEGSGLGLTISKAYVEMLGGNIWVESKQGLGSTFYFAIPYHTNEETIHKNETEAQVKKRGIKLGLKVLIVEDDDIAITYLSVILKAFKTKILVVKTGVEALETCHNNPDIDIILMDIKIPGINGYEVTRRIRKFNKKVFIVAQTAYAQMGDLENCIKAGCDDYIAKPVKKEKLLEIISNHF